MAQQHATWQQQANFDADGMMFDTDEAGSGGPPQGTYSSPGQYSNRSGSSYQHMSTRPDLNLDSTLSSSHLQQQIQQEPQPLPTPNTSTSTAKRQYSTTQPQTQTQIQPRTQFQHPATSTNPRAIRNPRRQPTPSSNLFGGVEALLREGQDWWMRDQNLPSGFGNWRNSITNNAPSMAGFDWASQQQAQNRRPGGRQPSWSQHAGIGGEDGDRRSSIGYLETSAGFVSVDGGVAGGGYGFEHLNNQYDENEWYQ